MKMFVFSFQFNISIDIWKCLYFYSNFRSQYIYATKLNQWCLSDTTPYTCIGQENIYKHPDSKVHGANMGPTGPRWAPCWPHELCYLGVASKAMTHAFVHEASNNDLTATNGCYYECNISLLIGGRHANTQTVTSRERHGVPNHRKLDCLFNSLFRLITKTSKFHITDPLWWPFVRGIHRSPVDSPHKEPVM